MKTHGKLLAVLAALVALNVVLAGLLYAKVRDTGPDPLAPRTGFASGLIHSPALPDIAPDRLEPRPASSPIEPPSYSLQARWESSRAYVAWGADMRVWVQNTGRNDIFVYGVRLERSWGATVNITAGVTIHPGGEGYVGLLHISGPADPGPKSYTLKAGILAYAGSPLDEWYDYGYVGSSERTIDFQPPGKVRSFSEIDNPAYYFDKANRLMNSKDPAVVQLAGRLAAGFPGPYSIYQMAAAFDFAHDNITYKAEPEGQDHWQAPSETLKLGTGDCEDYALLFCALVTAMNGTTRFEVEDNHAFASVYAGTDLAAVSGALQRYYGTDVNVAAFHDRYGWWLAADPTDSMYPGALPLGGEPMAHGWGLTNTTVHYIVDMLPD